MRLASALLSKADHPKRCDTHYVSPELSRRPLEEWLELVSSETRMWADTL